VPALKLVVGLGNPSPEYDETRHNVGALWVRSLARRCGVNLAPETKFKGEMGRGQVGGVDLRLLVPSTYMNLSGESVGAVSRFYKISAEEILVAYDEMAFDPGVVRLRHGGGDNGHNGIRSVRAGLANNADFHRLRIGVGHPGHKFLVTGYLTQQKMPVAERDCVEAAVAVSDSVLAAIVHGDWQAAMNVLHQGGP
jgi:PTH1 family peptidyl-tRNA hydrolase